MYQANMIRTCTRRVCTHVCMWRHRLSLHECGQRARNPEGSDHAHPIFLSLSLTLALPAISLSLYLDSMCYCRIHVNAAALGQRLACGRTQKLVRTVGGIADIKVPPLGFYRRRVKGRRGRGRRGDEGLGTPLCNARFPPLPWRKKRRRRRRRGEAPPPPPPPFRDRSKAEDRDRAASQLVHYSLASGVRVQRKNKQETSSFRNHLYLSGSPFRT